MAGLTHADHAEIAGMQLANHHDSTALNASAHQKQGKITTTAAPEFNHHTLNHLNSTCKPTRAD